MNNEFKKIIENLPKYKREDYMSEKEIIEEERWKIEKIMNNDYKKGFLEAIDGVLDILNEAGLELDKENRAFKYELKKLENSVLGLKVAFFESYYVEEDKLDLKKIGEILKDNPPRIMTEEQFDNESRRAQEKNPDSH